MKYSYFSKIQIQIKTMNVSLAHWGKAMLKRNFAEACFSKKEIIR